VRPDDDQNLGGLLHLVAIERHPKLVLNIAMGKRDQATTDGDHGPSMDTAESLSFVITWYPR